jgi:hypothetical protein
MLKPPLAVADLVRAAVPTAIREQWDVETPHTASRWLWHDFQGRPGFLFDELGLATYIGLNRKGLQMVCSVFESARYRGVFVSDGRPRWWVVSIRDIVEGKIGNAVMGGVFNHREEFLESCGVKKTKWKDLFSRAHGRRGYEKVPDCVAYRDDQREEGDRVQALFLDTHADERDANSPFGFESRRIYGPSIQQ